jgi:ribose transport system permease protein
VSEARAAFLGSLAERRRILLQEYTLALVVLAIIVVGGILEGQRFVSKDNFLNVLTEASIIGVIAIGMTFVIATAGIDLSVGSMLAASTIAGAQFVEMGWLGEGTAVFILGAIGFAMLLGAVNGIAVAWGLVVPFIATLAMFAIARGLALWMSDRNPISLDLELLRQEIGLRDVIGVPVPVIIFLTVAALGWILLNKTPYGRAVVAVGGNPEAARIAGLRVRWTRFTVYVLSGFCVGIGAIILTSRLSTASPISGNLYELDAIAAVVIGGTTLAGGRATIVGTVLGVVTFALIFNLLTIMNLPIEIQQIVKGVIILAAVLVQRRTA